MVRKQKTTQGMILEKEGDLDQVEINLCVKFVQDIVDKSQDKNLLVL